MSFLTVKKTKYTDQKITEYKSDITRVKIDYLKRIFAAELLKIALMTQIKLKLNFVSLFINNISYIDAANRSWICLFLISLILIISLLALIQMEVIITLT